MSDNYNEMIFKFYKSIVFHRSKVQTFDAAIELSLSKAYDDNCRTLKGLKEWREKIVENKSKKIFIAEYSPCFKCWFEINDPKTQKNFDKWHRCLCESMKLFFVGTDNKSGEKSEFVRKDKNCGFTIGNAQKIVNMTFKYLFCLMNENSFGYKNYDEYFKYCHYTLDEITIEKVTDKGKNYAWSSNIDCYDDLDNSDSYMGFQNQIRKSCNDDIKPFFKEFDDWNK